MPFADCIGPILDVEGREYEKVPGDYGGATFCGIDSKDDAAWPGWHSVYADIGAGKLPQNNYSTMAAVNSWYFNKYWIPAQLDYFPPQLQQAAFGSAVNQGLEGMTKLLQKALNRVGQSITVDGNLGVLTLKAVNAAPLLWLEDAFKLMRINDYLLDANADPATQEQFLDGWEMRVFNGD